MKVSPTCLVFVGLMFTVSAQVLMFDNTPIVVNVGEDETLRRSLHMFECITYMGTNTMPYSVRLESIVPSFPCGSCFDIYEDGNNFVLYYLPSQGKPDFDITRAYNLTVSCTDDTLNTTTTRVEIRVFTNHLPIFTTPIDSSCSVDGTFTAAGTIIHHVIVTDEDNDDLNFTMTVTPDLDSAQFYIDNEGYIRNRYAMERICNPTISFHVYVTDHKSVNKVGPALVTCTVNNFYLAPTIANVDKEISLPENTTVPSTIVTMFTTPSIPIVRYDFSTVPSGAAWLFDIVNNNLRLVNEPSFENAAFQNFNISIFPYNEYCRSSGHFLFVRITDVNDVPRLVPDIVYLSVNEGTIDTSFATILIDHDFGDTHTYSIIAGDDNDHFDIIQTNRHIISVGTYDVDQGKDPENVTLHILVTDSKGAMANSTVRIRIDDINDNAPVIDVTSFPLTVTGCSYLNSNMGQITATDLDSARNGNNRITFTEKSNGPLHVSSDGNIYVSGLMTAGESYSLEVYAKDHGTDPGPLQSIIPASITLAVTDCPTTPAPVVVNASSNTNSSSSSSSSSSASSGSSSSSSSSSSQSATGTTNSGTLDDGTIAAIVVGAIALPLLLILGVCLFAKCCPGAFGSFKASCCGDGAPQKPSQPPQGTKERDYWRPPSDRSHRKVTPEKPKTPEQSNKSDPFDFWANGTSSSNAAKPKPAADIGASTYM